MALTGIEIYKLLPKTNCKKCGFPTCLAFAMKLASGQTELAACPDISEEAERSLTAASSPPMRLVTIGTGERKIEVGGETALFRHDKTFSHPAALVVRVRDTASTGEVSRMAEEVTGYRVERMGMMLGMDGIAIQNESGDAATFAVCAAAVIAQTDLPLILMATDPLSMAAALAKVGHTRPAIYAASKDNIDRMIQLAGEFGCPLILRSTNGLGELAELSEEASAAGLEDLILDPGGRGFGETLVTMTQMRRLAVKKSFPAMGYPVITFPGEAVSSPEEEAVLAAQHVAKYGNIIVLDHFSPAMAYSLLTLRLNIYSDPQKPGEIEPGIYSIGEPEDSSPLCVTTNFPLTYYSIAGELEAGGWPSWLVVCDTEGLSVLSAWSAGKFDAERIAETVKEHDAASRLNHKRLILPGKVAVLRSELEEELSDWQIMVGPSEAMDIGGYLNQNWN
ncbi:acetyl-CoA decarbonylase/synthase complex subunit gamma [Dehalococcoidia bacterium]|nr:acetyl-CoA decarbonylase/synthase complex subunit gamma [Dehalococcoidia bacterium]